MSCKQVWTWLRMHAERCTAVSCRIPDCDTLRNAGAASSAPSSHVLPPLSGNAMPASDATRPPFFQLFDIITAKLSSARQSNDYEAREFYGHLEEWFMSKTKEAGFTGRNFDSSLVEQCIQSFGATAQRLATANSRAKSIHQLEIKGIIDDCKSKFPVAPTISIKAEESIKLEEDQFC